jgi:hypothetical protein
VPDYTIRPGSLVFAGLKGQYVYGPPKNIVTPFPFGLQCSSQLLWWQYIISYLYPCWPFSYVLRIRLEDIQFAH